MNCPHCVEPMYHQEGWEEYWDGETEECYYWGRWDCVVCLSSVHKYDAEYESPDDEEQ